jgi:hypothetical protein
VYNSLTFESLPVAWCTNRLNIQQLYVKKGRKQFFGDEEIENKSKLRNNYF